MTKQLSFSDGTLSTLTEKFFLVLLGSYLVVGTLRTTSLEYTLPPFFTAVVAAGLLAIIGTKFLLLHSYSVKEAVLYSATFVIVLVVVLRNHHDTLMMLFLLVIASKGIDFQKIVLIQILAVAEVLILSAILSQVGISADFGDAFSSEMHKTFGVCNTTDFAAYILFLILGYTFLRGNRITYAELISFVAIDIWVYKRTAAETTFFALLIFCLLVGIHKLIVRRSIDLENLKLASLGMFLIPLLSISMLGFSFVFSEENELMEKIDIFLTHRIQLNHRGLEQYGLALFGNKVIEHGYGFREKPSSYFFIDSSYMRLFLIDGLLIYFIVMITYCIIYKKLLAGKSTIGLIIFFIIAITCITEQHLLEPWYNPFTLLCLANLISQKGETPYEGLHGS